MALRGIDAQIMIQRTTDYSKEVENDLRRGQLMQDYASAVRKAGEDEKINTVARREDPDKTRMSREREGREQGEPDGEKDGGKPEPDEAREEDEAPCTGKGHVIDITL